MNKMISILFFFIFLTITPAIHADIEWGGGNVLFRDINHQLLTNYNGLAALISVRQGQLISMDAPDLEQSEIWVTPGSVITYGMNTNIVVAVSWAFDQGLLWMSGSPYVSTDTMKTFGMMPGDQLYLIVWDRNTFQWNHPVEESNYTVLPLFIDGNKENPAIAYGDDNFGDSIRPEKSLELAMCDQYFLKPEGDIDADGLITLKDVIMILQILTKIEYQQMNDIINIDINGNGRIDYGELLFVLKKLSG